MTEEDWDTVYRISHIQRTKGILWKQCKEYLSDTSAGVKAHTGFLNEVYSSECFKTDMGEVDKILTKAGVPYTLMKGIVIRDCYPDPLLRTMSDIDLIIQSRDREKSHREMVEAGYTYDIPTDEEYLYFHDFVEYEFHDTMIAEPLSNNVDYHAYFEKVWDFTAPNAVLGDSTYRLMDKNFHFLFLLVHLAKHILDFGMGIRSYMDLPLYAKAYANQLDWEWINQELEKLELLKFARICETFCEKWFGIGFPIEGLAITDEFYESATMKILQQGIYGHADKDNKVGYTAKAVRRSDKPYWYVTLRIIARRIFPAYRDMRLIHWYSFVDGRPWLMPAAWIYRWIYVLMKKRTIGRGLLMEPVEMKDVIDRRQKYYDDWGL